MAWKEVPLPEADALAKAGLLWYDCAPYDIEGMEWPAPWSGSGWDRDMPTPTYPTDVVRANPKAGYKFFLLLED